MKTLFGVVPVANPRWHRCPCQGQSPKTFRPGASWLVGQTSPELQYVETKWASLIPFAKVAELLHEVLPVDAYPQGNLLIGTEETARIIKKSGVDAVIVGNAS